MFNNENKLAGLIIKLIETPTGKQIISCQYEGKHYCGFVNEKETTGKNGETWIDKFAYLRICDWSGCKICHPVVVFF